MKIYKFIKNIKLEASGGLALFAIVSMLNSLVDIVISIVGWLK